MDANLPDIQDLPDARGISLDEVGISGLRLPCTIADGELRQSGVAKIEITVALPEDRKGTHMSRMVELATEHLHEFDPRDLPIISKAFATRCCSQTLALCLSMPVATPVSAPVSGVNGWQTHDLEFRVKHTPESCEVHTQLTTDVTSLCPCSKAISDYGAHNQRSRITLSLTGDADDPYPWGVTAVAEMLRSAGSAPVYPIVKRPDERHITMQAFDRPAFVEDIARDVSLKCRSRGISHRLAVRNLESIHQHDAVARLQWEPGLVPPGTAEEGVGLTSSVGKLSP